MRHVIFFVYGLLRLLAHFAREAHRLGLEAHYPPPEPEPPAIRVKVIGLP